MIIGTAGHIDHGKTTLVKALTGTDADRLKEEKARGITIDLGFAYARFAGEAVTGFIDVPGHEKFIHTMLAGAGGIDYALLVIAADDGIKPQTREHLAILDLLGIDRGIVALTKVDLADATRIASVTNDIHVLLAPTRLSDIEILPVSASTGQGMDELKSILAEAERATVETATEGRFRLAVDRSFTLPGAGTVVTGTVLSGSVAIGDAVTVSPSGLSARVRSIHAQNVAVERGFAGQRCALNLAGEAIAKDAIHRGDMIVDPVLHAPTNRIDAELSVLSGEPKAIGQWFSARFHHESVEAGVRIVPLEGPVLPGSTARVQLVLDRPIAAAVGDRFILRDVSAQRTIGGGSLIDLRPPARKRRTPERLKQLTAAAKPGAAEQLFALLDVAPFFVDLNAFARDRAMSVSQLTAATEAVGIVLVEAGGVGYAMSATHRAAFTTQLIELLTAFHAESPELQGQGRERLRMAMTPRLPAPAFLAVLRTEVAAGNIVLEGAFVRLSGHIAQLGEVEETLYAEILPHLIGENRFRPPRVRDFADMLGADEREVRRVLKLCARLGRVDQVRHDHFFTRATTAEMVEIVRQVAAQAEHGEFAAAAFRDRVSSGRKVAIEILEFFDRHGVTLRRGDLRRINPHRLDLFGPSVADAENGRGPSPTGRLD
ncbi:selenocysteine-specific translation elongation factor SelB [Rhizobium sp. NFR07]|uniref:selenocysteine-specific translation elongation factor n=1 Tax=Rhizobium sp. NFR07 TaxID=1566262 RepID=UPI0008F36F21|nr:selenocysteine-specific translation elongation factor [Rhizobium sp. NFR07]SFB33221.1 selenocysteine-specific translation elongation factor SelB [Rhizobium sp. NFR07]